MSNIKNRLATDLEFLRQLHPDNLLRWLMPIGDFLSRNGFKLPSSGAAINYEHLVDVLANPDAPTPDSFLESIYLVRTMANEEGKVDILGQEDLFGTRLKVDDHATPADVAVHAWLQNPQVLENLIHQRNVRARRSFTYFGTDQQRLTPFIPPTAQQLEALQERLDAYCKARNRGKGCKVTFYPSEAEILFLVRHGLSTRRAAALKDGEPTSVFYRPQWHDVIVYNIAQDELRLNCCDAQELKVFKRIFGSCLFGDANYFPGDAIYTLDPLLRDGRESLVCTDVPGMKNVVCKEVEITYDKGPERRENIKARDIFQLIDQNALSWPAKGRLSKATFEIRFTGSGKARKVTILPANKLLLTRDADAPIVHDWLQRRSFTSVS